MHGAASTVTPPVAGAPAPEVRQPELQAPPVNWGELISKLGQMGIDTTSGIFGAASSLAQDPNNIGLIANGQGIPGVSNKDIAALGAIAKGFESSRPKPLDPLTQANIDKLNAETTNLKKGGGGGKDQFQIEDKLAGDYEKIAKPYNEDLQKFNQIDYGLTQGTPSGDATALLSYAKLIVPTLRTDAEAAEAITNNVSGLGILKNAFDKTIKNKRIGADEAENLMNLTNQIITNRKEQFDSGAAVIKKRAEAWDVPLERIEQKTQENIQIKDNKKKLAEKILADKEAEPDDIAWAKKQIGAK